MESEEESKRRIGVLKAKSSGTGMGRGGRGRGSRNQKRGLSEDENEDLLGPRAKRGVIKIESNIILKKH